MSKRRLPSTRSQSPLEMKDRIRFLEQRTKLYDIQLTKLVAKLQLISALLEEKFGTDLSVRSLNQVVLEDIPNEILQGIKARSGLNEVTFSAPSPSSDSDVQIIEHTDTQTEKMRADAGFDMEGAGESSASIFNLRKRSVHHDYSGCKSTVTLTEKASSSKASKTKPVETLARKKATNQAKPIGIPMKNRKFCQAVGRKGSAIIPATRRRKRMKLNCPWPDCSYRSARSDSINSHMRTHTGERPYICPVPNCQKSYATRCNLRQHRLTQHNAKLEKKPPPKGFQCLHCGHRWVSKKVFATHIRITHTKEEPPFTCKICGAKFFHKTAKRLHMISIHA